MKRGDCATLAGILFVLAVIGLGLGAALRELTWGRPFYVWTRMGWVEVK